MRFLMIPLLATALFGQSDFPVPLAVIKRAPGVAKRAAVQRGQPPRKTAALPDGAVCVSGNVFSVTFSLEKRTPGLADEILIGEYTLCPKCEIKPPIYVELVRKLERAYDTGAPVDACFDDGGFVNYLRIRNAN